MVDQTLPGDAINGKNGKTREKQKTSDWAKRTAAKLNKTRKPIAEKLRGTAEAIQDQAQSLYAGEHISEGVSDVAYGAAERVESSADYLESHDFSQMAEDAMAVVRRNPLPAIAVAAAAGFLLGRALTRR
jgi:ElaB/YqjD/DUF883 family membrane-anchored ribosome-binding protein